MIKYEIREIYGDWGIFEMRWGANGWEDATEECLLILNSRSNAEYIKAILEHEARHPNAAVPYSPEVAGMSDEECLAVFRLCDGKRFQCKSCPLYAFDGFDKCSELERRVLAIVDRVVSAADVVPKSEYDELKAMLDATIAGQETLQEALAEAKSEVAREFIKACDSMLSLVCEMTGLEMTFFGNYAKLKKKYTEGKTDENISD